MNNVNNQINAQMLNDLTYMINAEKELYKEISDENKKIKNFIVEEKPKDSGENISLEKEVKNLKNYLTSFEEKNGFISPYHDDIINKMKSRKVIQKMSSEISQLIYEFYQKKYFLDCYDLWSLYGFKLLLNITPEENFEMLRHLTKVKDDLIKHKYIMNNLENFNYFDDYDFEFKNELEFDVVKKFKNNMNENSVSK